MIRARILLLAAIFIAISAQSQNINKGFRKLKREKYIQAKVIFDNVLNSGEIAEHPPAFYGLASIYNSSDYQGHDQLKALNYSAKAMDALQKLKQEQKEDAVDIISKKEMQKQLQALDEQYVAYLRQKRDLNSLNQYLEKFASTPHRKEMVTFRNKLAWQKAKGYNTIPAYERYIKKYPQAKFVDKAKKAINKLKYEKAIESGDADALKNFIKQHPQSAYAQKAKEKIEIVEYKQAKELNSIEYYERFIKQYSNSDKIAEIKSLRNKKAFEMAQFLNSVKAYEDFMRKYPQAEQITEAKEMRNKVAYQKAIEKNTARAFQEFIHNYPNAKQVDEFKEKLQKMNLSPQLIELQKKQAQAEQKNLKSIKSYADVEKEKLSTEKKYDKTGRKTLNKTIEEDKTEKISFKYSDKQKGYPASKVFYQEGNKVKTITLETDENGNLIKKTQKCETEGPDCRDYTQTFSYDQRQYLAQILKTSGEDTLAVIEVIPNSTGQVGKKNIHQYSPQGIKKSTVTYSYDSNGKILEEIHKDQKEQVVKVNRFSYQDNLLKSRQTYDEIGKRKKVFQYDEKGNKASATVYSLPSKKIISEEFFEYSYY